MSANTSKSAGTNPSIAGKTRDSARDTARQTQQAIEDNPVAALIGGVAIGAAIGALLPKTSVESAHLGPLGRKLTDGATAAARAARDAGREELSALTPDKDSAKAKAASIFEHVATAARESARSAAKV